MERRSLRVGIAVILSALVLRLWAAGLPRWIADALTQPDTAAFLIYLETGRNVRFSPSQTVFSPQFVESAPPSEENGTIPETLTPENVEIFNTSGLEPDVEALFEAPLSWNLQSGEPTVLILHTHTTESYTRQGEDYQETSSWRTLAEEYNMLSIGQRVGQLLAEEGICAVQDRQLHDYPSYNGSYVHARAAIAEMLERYPSIRLVLDLHRDASGGEQGQLRTRAQVDGKDAAQLMIVLGGNHEAYEENLSLALKLHALLEAKHSGLMRPLQLRPQRFNQDLSPGALLIEVGAAGNTHAEAMAAAEALAEAIAELADGYP